MRPSVTCIQVCFSAKEIQDRHAVLSERAVLIRVHRIMQRLQNVALVLKPIALMTGSSKKRRTRRKKNSQIVKHFSLKDFAGFLPISKIRRRLSLDFSPTSSDGK